MKEFGKLKQVPFLQFTSSFTPVRPCVTLNKQDTQGFSELFACRTAFAFPAAQHLRRAPYKTELEPPPTLSCCRRRTRRSEREKHVHVFPVGPSEGEASPQGASPSAFGQNHHSGPRNPGGFPQPTAASTLPTKLGGCGPVLSPRL